MKVLFVGESWNGSSARSLRQALSMAPGVDLEEVSEDHFFPKHRALGLRLLNRVVRRLHVGEFHDELRRKLEAHLPEVLIVYKGTYVESALLREAKKNRVLTVNIFPDYSPHNQGRSLQESLAIYDLVISTKPFHPALWRSLYGYANDCVFVPHGYDPAVHFWPELPVAPAYDVVLAATCRTGYLRLMQEFAVATSGLGLKVAVAGHGWAEHANTFPLDWVFEGAKVGRQYCEWLRQGKIVVAPVNGDVVVSGVTQPGDQDTTRTYELAAACCFFLHQRTDYVQSVYDEHTEVPMWNTPAQLADLVKLYLPQHERRRDMALAAHRRAMPAYSIPSRAQEVAAHIRKALKERIQ